MKKKISIILVISVLLCAFSFTGCSPQLEEGAEGEIVCYSILDDEIVIVARYVQPSAWFQFTYFEYRVYNRIDDAIKLTHYYITDSIEVIPAAGRAATFLEAYEYSKDWYITGEIYPYWAALMNERLETEITRLNVSNVTDEMFSNIVLEMCAEEIESTMSDTFSFTTAFGVASTYNDQLALAFDAVTTIEDEVSDMPAYEDDSEKSTIEAAFIVPGTRDMLRNMWMSFLGISAHHLKANEYLNGDNESDELDKIEICGVLYDFIGDITVDSADEREAAERLHAKVKSEIEELYHQSTE